VIQLDPQDGEAWHERGQCYAELSDHAAAARDRQRARELDPTIDSEGNGSESETEGRREGEN
jgi:Flp pilus assembly protein TadD